MILQVPRVWFAEARTAFSARSKTHMDCEDSLAPAISTSHGSGLSSCNCRAQRPRSYTYRTSSATYSVLCHFNVNAALFTTLGKLRPQTTNQLLCLHKFSLAMMKGFKDAFELFLGSCNLLVFFLWGIHSQMQGLQINMGLSWLVLVRRRLRRRGIVGPCGGRRLVFDNQGLLVFDGHGLLVFDGQGLLVFQGSRRSTLHGNRLGEELCQTEFGADIPLASSTTL